MSTKLEDVIRDAALKNRVGLKEDDPVMVLVTIMNRIIEDHVAGLNAALESERGVIQEIAMEWKREAVENADRVMNAALATGREAIANGMNEGGTKVVTLLHGELDKARQGMAGQREGIESAVESHKKLCKAMLVANAAMLAAAAIIAALA